MAGLLNPRFVTDINWPPSKFKKFKLLLSRAHIVLGACIWLTVGYEMAVKMLAHLSGKPHFKSSDTCTSWQTDRNTVYTNIDSVILQYFLTSCHACHSVILIWSLFIAEPVEQIYSYKMYETWANVLDNDLQWLFNEFQDGCCLWVQ